MVNGGKSERKTALKLLKAAEEGNIRDFTNAAKKLGKGKRIAEAIAGVGHREENEIFGAIHIAAVNGRTEICRYLIEELGFDPNLVPGGDSRKTPIFQAIFGGHVDTVRYLLDHGANPDARDRVGFTSLHSAVLQGNAEILDLLLSRGGPIEARNIAGTPLILATCKADCSCMKVLLRHNADPNQVTSGFFSPLFVSVINDSIECVEALLKAGADVNKTPLLELAFDSMEMFDYLLEAGADPNKPNDYGRLPIEIAAVRGKRKVVEKLYALTSPIPFVLDWSIDGLFRHVDSPIYHVEEMAQSKKRLERLKWKAESALSRKDYMVSIFLFAYAMMEDPNDATIHANSSLCWLQFGDGKRALADAYECQRLRADWPISYLRVGSALSCLKEYDKAFMAFVTGLSLDPTNRDIQKALKQTLEQKANDTQLAGPSIVKSLGCLSIT
ncbi:hypothetical protein LUZ63_015680 [Rhynchospora breviuscula]|uniref:Ankyrin repeat protein n=1 Tax=Rhynchospora breviuscula TaxID=2022672 RepID=A0A9Q0CCV4_9POAL|nr:hypothetical protein LUZ63_015680 [Rhynchospora breviuscula]